MAENKDKPHGPYRSIADRWARKYGKDESGWYLARHDRLVGLMESACEEAVEKCEPGEMERLRDYLQAKSRTIAALQGAYGTGKLQDPDAIAYMGEKIGDVYDERDRLKKIVDLVKKEIETDGKE